MQIIEEFFERDTDNLDEVESRYRVRKAASAVLFDDEKRIALIFVSAQGYHRLPCGRVLKGENLEAALRRAMREKTGSDIVVRPRSVGAILEYRDSEGKLIISYCYLADVKGKPGATHFGEREKAAGCQLEWQKLDDAIEMLEKDAPSDYAGKFNHQRDLLFLRQAGQMLAKED